MVPRLSWTPPQPAGKTNTFPQPQRTGLVGPPKHKRPVHAVGVTKLPTVEESVRMFTNEIKDCLLVDFFTCVYIYIYIYVYI